MGCRVILRDFVSPVPEDPPTAGQVRGFLVALQTTELLGMTGRWLAKMVR